MEKFDVSHSVQVLNRRCISMVRLLKLADADAEVVQAFYDKKEFLIEHYENEEGFSQNNYLRKAVNAISAICSLTTEYAKVSHHANIKDTCPHFAEVVHRALEEIVHVLTLTDNENVKRDTVPSIYDEIESFDLKWCDGINGLPVGDVESTPDFSDEGNEPDMSNQFNQNGGFIIKPDDVINLLENILSEAVSLINSNVAIKAPMTFTRNIPNET